MTLQQFIHPYLLCCCLQLYTAIHSSTPTLPHSTCLAPPFLF
jgi:hypothetical protein